MVRRVQVQWVGGKQATAVLHGLKQVGFRINVEERSPQRGLLCKSPLGLSNTQKNMLAAIGSFANFRSMSSETHTVAFESHADDVHAKSR